MTQINYPDIVRNSPDGKLRLEVRSPDNDAISPRDDPSNNLRKGFGGFQRDFAFTVRRNSDEGVIWQRTAGVDELLDAPCDAWLANDAQVIVITRHPFSSQLFFLGSQGELRLQRDVQSEVLHGNDTELRWTSAGPHWNDRGVGLFSSCRGSHFWCFRTQLGRQIVLDLEGSALQAVTEEIAESLRAAQAAWSLSTLDAASKDLRLFDMELYEELCQNEINWDYISAVWAALQWSGMDRLVLAVPYLQKFEASEVWDSYGPGWLEDTWRVRLAFVRISQSAMRCMNVEPGGRAAYWLCHRLGPSQASRIEFPECVADRADRSRSLRVEMTPREVAELLGMPDVDWRKWDYDLLDDKEGPCTMRIHWNLNTTRVKAIERCPPAWHDMVSRAIWL